jgi:peptidoglycan/xylan/chitin deacetylase (PgdA/CDA1 family)
VKLTLTFDNGPDPAATPRVLEILRARGALAHFFVLGKHVATPAGRALVERELAEGHLVGNHSYSHATPLGDDPRTDAVAQEIVATQALLEPLLQRDASPRRFRPFGGGGFVGPHLLSAGAAAHLVAERYTCVLWNSVPRDWVDRAAWPAAALADLAAHDHTVLVLHDIVDASVAALDDFLATALERGAQITLDLPRSCTPILAGDAIAADLAPLVRQESVSP